MGGVFAKTKAWVEAYSREGCIREGAYFKQLCFPLIRAHGAYRGGLFGQNDFCLFGSGGGGLIRRIRVPRLQCANQVWSTTKGPYVL